MTVNGHEVDPQPTDAVALIDTRRSSPRPHAPLSKDLIVGAAINFIDDHGLPRLTMRALGSLLGVEAMSLYRHIGDKDNLLDAVVNVVVGELSNDPAVSHTPVDGWEAFLQQLAHGIRRVALRHPRVFPLVAARSLEAALSRPQLRTLRWVEAVLDSLLAEGFSDIAASAACRTYSSFLLGHLLLEVSGVGRDLSPINAHDDAYPATGDLTEFPTVQRLKGELTPDQATRNFAETLECVLGRIARLHGT